ncbi:NAD-dependent malic enzyme [Candidatus Uhrbacteria bacterium CG_4_9_14_0_2_um_filter_41_50]|uniref:NAD-dependent malic enzyme n=1 Tax=Candidatus Uhrbacteria bacterium CG_4_9_14_0_2_um_filter_41_50 TaxID=1975031 RepID=A0A2M8ENC3_9BACT|nr:MAG: NAD-dependent malic enzyme [Candidatus Uhrbacteria bacterium CG_4_10_14_3_um_filter_41_21]PIZ55366.1 MAG: NAD-dependent malic enzyme [Candidatus Uhrbacteria bacterium CG_4_10_14_0_2_um_filter_41_21]PJB84306.1 MAG: NAD-dependent malic enzyme [Candidatus Uhrbacteria bacterium CG_4_9_14_0_8_um_filter_41_16]PJC24234.1 MAG: NAD-dependent malic enzyme [Candidatus Uhrbacteria bacterium CG_4_9_14_0_2_um_filter_41_50]PJE74864.1 MAG: NAD-dependent malic enzyme [Candidatus Uhrbacteria bacterium CG
MDYSKESIKLHKEKQGKISLASKVPVDTRDDLSLAYTPGVAAVCMEIAKNPAKVWELTSRKNWVAVVTDGSAVLGLGNIGPEAGLPVMEGKAILFKEFANVDAFPICLATQDTEEIIETVKRLAPSFGGINLEDISAPRCFEIETRLKAELDIPVFHDDQHGTAIVVLAGLINALKVVGKDKSEINVVVSGAGAAGVAVTKLLLAYGVGDVIMLDSKGALSSTRDDLNDSKKEMLAITNKSDRSGSLAEVIVGADVFIGVSAPGILTGEMVKSMNTNSIIFAMANPVPEIMPDKAKAAGAAVVATGRSDYPNQINNVLVFPGIFRGAIDGGIKDITDNIKLSAAKALASYVENPTADLIIPNPLDKGVAGVIARAVKNTRV